MKKLLIFLATCLISSNLVFARDYTKLQVKEMKHAQKYGTTQKVLVNTSFDTAAHSSDIATSNIKDPKIMKFGKYEKVSDKDLALKLKSDDEEYAKYSKALRKRTVDNYNAQAKGDDYYKIYRIAEKLIRANKLDYINWRIAIYRDAESPNAYTSGVNYIAISTALVDTFADNDDALALVIGHEMGHALLGHQKRSAQLIKKINRAASLAKATGSGVHVTAYSVMKRKFLIDSKNMEYAADVEGAKLVMHAGYNLNNASDVLKFISTYDLDSDYRSDHPRTDKRLENLRQNVRYFPRQWSELGDYNIYHSSVLPVKLSSDRKSIVISAAADKLNPDKYYSPESMDELYARLGYTSYLNGEFSKALKYFDDLFAIDKTNAPAYLYASYASEYLYKNTKEKKYYNLSKEYAKTAYKIDPKNKYIKEQVDSL